LIDVRRTEEPDENGYIDYDPQVHFPLETFIETIPDWPADLDTPIVVYCGSGHRSTIAMTILWSYGYTDVHSLRGGFGGWASAGLPAIGRSGTGNGRDGV
jgi:rhodanese-related sulfurtransferase